ncbi:hypothetical protein HAX54_004019, partial [Datura stramonium]|nr:hypothetical protein [Datura stramonium]
RSRESHSIGCLLYPPLSLSQMAESVMVVARRDSRKESQEGWSGNHHVLRKNNTSSRGYNPNCAPPISWSLKSSGPKAEFKRGKESVEWLKKKRYS